MRGQCTPHGGPPLGTGNASSGLQCARGETLADGFYTLQNLSDEAVAVTAGLS